MEELKERLVELEKEREKRVARYTEALKFVNFDELDVEQQIDKEEEIYRELGVLNLDAEISELEARLIEEFLEKSSEHDVIAGALGDNLSYIKKNYRYSFAIRERLLSLAKKVNFDTLE